MRQNPHAGLEGEREGAKALRTGARRMEDNTALRGPSEPDQSPDNQRHWVCVLGGGEGGGGVMVVAVG